jgi:acyl-CoA thioesterase-2
MGDFEIDTRLEPVGTAGEGRFRAVLSRDWEIWGPNGGYVASIALRAAGQVAKIARPATFSGHFLSVAGFDVVDVAVRTIRAGRRAESLAVSIQQGDRPVFEGLVRTAALAPGLEHDVAVMPDVPRPKDLKLVTELLTPEQLEEGPPFPFWLNFDSKPVEPDRFGEPERKPRAPVFREWYRFAPRATFDDPFLDAARALLMIDTASWIAASQPHPDSGFVAPNLDVTAWFHRFEPESEWLLMDNASQLAEGGLMATDARIWSESGRLLATGGAQLLCTPRQVDRHG